MPGRAQALLAFILAPDCGKDVGSTWSGLVYRALTSTLVYRMRQIASHSAIPASAASYRACSLLDFRIRVAPNKVQSRRRDGAHL
jgi:hypothetical protein